MAKQKHYNWRNGLPILENHSKCKHEIIGEYLTEYVHVLAKGFLRFPNKTFNLTIVDGFAGGGKYLCDNQEVDGSPLVLIKALKKAEQLVQFERQQNRSDQLNINADFVFVEKNKDAVDFLKHTLRDEECDSDRVQVWHDEFGNHLPNIIKFVKNKSHGRKGRAIFILDQYGFSDVLLRQIRTIMNSLESEIILTFAVDSLVAFLCDRSTEALKKMGFSDDDIKQIQQQDNPDKCRAAIQYVFSRRIENMGYRFTPFCIYCDTSHWGYWLVHLSTHWRARDVMMDIHWSKGNQLVHYGGAGIDMFGYRSEQNEQRNKQCLITDVFRFNFGAEERVRATLRKEIPELIHQKDEIAYGDLRNIICNHTPANGKIIREILSKCMTNKEISVSRRNSENIKDNDIIAATRQTNIFLKK